MNVSVRRKALRHAAKVAFGSLVMGCGGTISAGDDTTTPDARANDAKQGLDVGVVADAAVADAVVADAVVPPSDASLMCTGPTDVDAATVDHQTFECCIALVENDVGDASPWGSDAGLTDPNAIDCCQAIISYVDHPGDDAGSWPTNYNEASPTFAWCCAPLGEPQGPACTPWGPPMPIPMQEVA